MNLFSLRWQTGKLVWPMIESHLLSFFTTRNVSIEETFDVRPSSTNVDAVIQSATPAAYPVIMPLLQSEKIRKNINIKELEVLVTRKIAMNFID